METTVHLNGIYWLLTQVPIWATGFILFTLALNVIFIGRDRFEGFPYNVSYSSVIGQTCLIFAILIVVTILQRMRAVPEVVQSGWFQICMASLSIFWPTVWLSLVLFGKRRDTKIDSYFHLVVVPLFIFLVLISWPILREFGSELEKLSVISFISCWIICFGYDAAHGRLQQTKYFCKWILTQSKAFLEHNKL